MAIKTTQEKYLHELGDIYDAENRFLKGQQEMLQAATDPTLKAGIEQHIGENEQQVATLEHVFELLGGEGEGRAVRRGAVDRHRGVAEPQGGGRGCDPRLPDRHRAHEDRAVMADNYIHPETRCTIL